jgi:hypothetical protein
LAITHACHQDAFGGMGHEALHYYIADNWSITASRLLDCSYCNWFETQSCNRFLTVTQTLVTLAVVNDGKLPH